MLKVIILPKAKANISDAAYWYENKQKNLGKKFLKEIRSKIRFIKQNPKAIAIRYDEVRTAVLKSFPFMIHYSIEENNKTIIVAAVFHTSLNPDVWTDL